MKKIPLLLLISIISFNGVQASVVQMPTASEEFSSTIHRNVVLINKARLKADLEDNAGIFDEAKSSLFKTINSEYDIVVLWEWALYLLPLRKEKIPPEEAKINEIDKTLESLNEQCINLLSMVYDLELTSKHRARIAKRKSEKDAAERVAYTKLKTKQKAHKSCSKAFNCNGNELTQLRLAEKEYQKYEICSDCSVGPVPITSLYEQYCPKYFLDGWKYTALMPFDSYGFQCKVGYKRNNNSCVKE